MKKETIFIYDGECPFCNKFAELIELKSNLCNLKIKNGREILPDLEVLLSKGYDLNNGAILITSNGIMQGANAITYICSHITNPSNSLLNILTIIFASKQRTNLLFPFLIWSRRILLSIKGINSQPVSENIH